MGDRTGIEWTDATWNPVRGCSRVSEGCRNCYAEGVAARFSGPGQPYEGLAKFVTRPDGSREARWTGAVSSGHHLEQPLRWRRPRRIFVNSMSDLFHERLAPEEIATVFGVAVAAHHLNGHTLQILTKRSGRMREILAREVFWHQVNAEAGMHVMDGSDPLSRRYGDPRATLRDHGPDNPPPGLWLGVSAEDQAAWDERVADLAATPAATRIVSVEPMLGPIDGSRYLKIRWQCSYCRQFFTGRHQPSCPECWHLGGWSGAHPFNGRQNSRSDIGSAVDWIICGGESGAGARPMHPDWAHALRDQCAAAGVPFFFKQWGEWAPHRMSSGCDLGREVRAGHARVVHPSGRSNEDVNDATGGYSSEPGSRYMARVGKASAGRLLDGREHNASPEATS